MTTRGRGTPAGSPSPSGRTAEAVVVGWGSGAPARCALPGLRRRVEQLSAAGVDIVVVGVGLDAAALAGRLRARAAGPGLVVLWSGDGDSVAVATREGSYRTWRRTPEAVSPRGPRAVCDEVTRMLHARGVPAGTVLVAGFPDGVSTEAECAALLGLLDAQVRRRRTRRVPEVSDDPAWAVALDDTDDLRRRVADALCTLSDGRVGTRGAPGATRDEDARLVLAAGVYTGEGSAQHLLRGPWWPAVRTLSAPATRRRVLDLRAGMLLLEGAVDVGGDPRLPRPPAFREVRFASAAHPGTLALRAEGPIGSLALAVPRVPDGEGTAERVRGGWAATAGPAGTLAVRTRDRVRSDAGTRTLERLATYRAGADLQDEEALHRRLDDAGALGFDALLRAHRRAWARRWDTVDVEIGGDPALQLAARFALFHLWGLAGADDELALGARGLSGGAYRGHVFWDADVFVLPALVTMSPAAARAMLTYRLRRLSRARAAAVAAGLEGARIPWESARDGGDVTPRWAGTRKRRVPILTGEQEEHVVADVAWAARHYAEWCADREWLEGEGRPLLVETARYWASRCRTDARGVAHIEHVIGPDEYHEDVDDNAFTNVMARWNLRHGAALLERADPSSPEAASWRALAARLADGHDPSTGRYVQFRGYDDLEPLTVDVLGRTPLAADLVLPKERLSASQIVKQPDVLMLHHLVPDELAAGSLQADLDFYLPRTAHGSSLSPAVVASLLARAGRQDEAVGLLRLALRMDLDDLTGTTPQGLHVAAQGGAWQALVHGFAGLRVVGGALVVEPSVPEAWYPFRLRARCLGRRVRLEVDRSGVRLRADGPLPVWHRGRPRSIRGEVAFERVGGGWSPKEE